MTNRHLILASTSIYRQQQLSQLGLAFECHKPLFDEDSFKNNTSSSAADLCRELTINKALSLSESYPQSTIIAGDQLVCFNQHILGKPHTHKNAISQLLQFNGTTHELLTGITVIHNKKIDYHINVTRLKMKSMTLKEIENYVALDNPIDCAGSYKIEKHGIALFEKIETTDFSAIQGIPLLWLSQKLKDLDYELFSK